MAVILVAVICAPILMAQQSAPTFAAASIRPPVGITGPIDFRFFPNRFVATRVTLGQLIEQAYNIRPRELVGGPDWVRVDRFDVVATSGTDVSQVDMLRLMLRSLLADRFQLQIEPETRTGTVYHLTIRNARNLNPPAKPDERSLVATHNNGRDGVLSYEYVGHNATMEQLAVTLGEHLRAPVSDDTKLRGSYDFRIKWTYDEPIFGVPPDPNIPSIFTALESDLGLKLVADKGQIPVHVIRHVARLSAQ